MTLTPAGTKPASMSHEGRPFAKARLGRSFDSLGTQDLQSNDHASPEHAPRVRHFPARDCATIKLIQYLPEKFPALCFRFPPPCLSEIKSGHIRDAIRRGPAAKNTPALFTVRDRGASLS